VDYLRDCGARADASVMNAVIHACHRLGQGQKALQVFETMVSNFLHLGLLINVD
jgi:pentatricopeptide repeat protein